MGWHEHDENVFIGCEQFFRPGYIANLIPSWIPALDDVQDRREGSRHRLRARRVHDPAGPGVPELPVHGSDYHGQSIEIARKRAADAGVAGRINFEVASATGFSGIGYDLAATFDCLHDLGDPLAAARHIRQALKPDGTWMVVEPYAADDVAGNLNPVGRIYYNASTQLCVPNALSQPAARRSALRQARPPSGRSPPKPDSPGSAGPPRRRSTSFTRSARSNSNAFATSSDGSDG